MKLITGWVMSAGLVLAGTAANAQVLAPGSAVRSPYAVVSDVGAPYAAAPREVPGAGYGPMLLPPTEVYTVLRESGFSPLGIPQRRGLFYTIAVIDRGGEDGRLVIDARNGRIVRFVPGYRIGSNLDSDPTIGYGQGAGSGAGPGAGSGAGPLPPVGHAQGPQRPPLAGQGGPTVQGPAVQGPAPRVASRMPATPMPKAAPPTHAGEPAALAAKPAEKPVEKPAAAPAQRSAAAPQSRPADAQAAVPAAPAPVEAKPTPPQLQPTQEMPKAQGLD
jgi:hypothetical protein